MIARETFNEDKKKSLLLTNLSIIKLIFLLVMFKEFQYGNNVFIVTIRRIKFEFLIFLV